MCQEILSPIHEELAVSSGLDASDVWRCAGHRLYVQLPRTLSSTGGEHASKAICSSTRPPKWILWKPVESITDLITLLVMTRSKVTWIVRKIQIISLIRADTNRSRPPSWKFLNEGKLLRRLINNVATRFTSYLSTNQRFLRPVLWEGNCCTCRDYARTDRALAASVFNGCCHPSHDLYARSWFEVFAARFASVYNKVRHTPAKLRLI